MFGRLVEKMMRGNKKNAGACCLSQYLDAISMRFAARYLECVEAEKAKNSQNAGDLRDPFECVDALDVLAQMVSEAQGIFDADVAASRACLSILIDNEHLPERTRLNDSELQVLRDLLLSYFGGANDTNEKGAQVLALIERKFSNGDFSQARILLQIFETNNETSQNNERNLFYEEMIMRLDRTASKCKPLPESLIADALKEDASDEAVLAAFSELERSSNLRFYLYLRDPDEVDQWAEGLRSLPVDIQQYMLDFVPIVRWRKLGDLDADLLSQFGMHMTYEMLRRHVQQKLRICYFILLTNGNTGYEWYIFAFSQWSKQHFDVDVCDVFPLLHRCGIVEGMPLQEALDIAIDRFYVRKMNEIAIPAETLERAYRDSVRFILTCDLTKITMENFSFGDFLLDRILPFEYDAPMFAFQIHAMM